MENSSINKFFTLLCDNELYIDIILVIEVRFFRTTLKFAMLFVAVVTISLGQGQYEYRYSNNKWCLFEISSRKKVQNPKNNQIFMLNTADLYDFLRKDTRKSIEQIIQMIKKQNGIDLKTELGYDDNGPIHNLGTFINELTNHIVEHGHYGYVPWAPEKHDERDGTVHVDRLETNNPRSYFIPSTELQASMDKYSKALATKLQDLFYPGCVSIASKNEEITTAYNDVIEKMKNDCIFLIKDVLNNKYECSEMDCDYKNDTIRIIASPKQYQMRNGLQPVYGGKSYDPTHNNIALYIGVKDGSVEIKSIFPALDLASLGRNTLGSMPRVVDPGINLNQ